MKNKMYSVTNLFGIIPQFIGCSDTPGRWMMILFLCIVTFCCYYVLLLTCVFHQRLTVL